MKNKINLCGIYYIKTMEKPIVSVAKNILRTKTQMLEKLNKIG